MKIVNCIKDNYEIKKERARGNYGIVYEAIRLSDSSIVAVKRPLEKYPSGTRCTPGDYKIKLEKMLNEIKFLKSIAKDAKNNHIINILDWNEDIDNLAIVMPLCDGTLADYQKGIGEDYKFNCSQLLEWIEQILKAVCYLHVNLKNTIHRDIKIENLLLKNNTIYLSDFGTKKDIKLIGTSSIAGTPEWGAPEQFIPEKIDINNNPEYRLTEKVDIYPIGLIIFTLMTSGDLPNSQREMKQLIDGLGRCLPNAQDSFQKIGGINKDEQFRLYENIQQLAKKNNIPFASDFSNALVEFVEKLLLPDIDKRPNALQAMKILKKIQERIKPKISYFRVNCPEKIQVGQCLNILIEYSGKGLPDIQKWLVIKDKNTNSSLSYKLNLEKNQNGNVYKVTLPEFKNEGIYNINIKALNSKKLSYYKKIKVCPGAEMLWNLKKYEEALMFYDHKQYNSWLKFIENESKSSNEKLNQFIKIFDKIMKSVPMKSCPDFYITCGRLLEIKKYGRREFKSNSDNYIITNIDNNEQLDDNKKKGFWPFFKKINKVKPQKKIEIHEENSTLNDEKNEFIDKDENNRNKQTILRSEPITVNHQDAKKIFQLDNKWRPLKYIKNEYVDNHDGTISDLSTNLMWQKAGSSDRLIYDEAQNYIINLNKEEFVGCKDWRLPTIVELMSLLENIKQGNNYYISSLFETKQYRCWSSDTRSSGSWWVVGFNYGSVDWYLVGNGYYVRGVRARQY